MDEEKKIEKSGTTVRKKAIVAAVALAMLATSFGLAVRAGWFGGAHGAAKSGKPAAEQAEKKILYWYDPMHPNYRSGKPGIAPDCGMALVPKYADEGAGAMPQGAVTLGEGAQQMAGVRTAQVERELLSDDLHTTAQIVADESRIAQIHVKYAGFLEKVFVSSIGQPVHKGQAVFTIYSPELVAAEQEYLIARRGAGTLSSSPFSEVRAGTTSLLASSRQKLKLLDVSEAQIAQIEERGEAQRELTVYSPVSGFVTERKAFPQTAVTPETDLYTVSDLSTVWAVADIYDYEAPYVHVGQKVTLQLSYAPGRSYTGTISFLYPTADAQTHTLKVRVALRNPRLELKPQMFADALLHVNYGRQLTVPQEAVLNNGATQQVFVVRPGGVFEPRTVTVGPVVNGRAGILSGLKEGETVVSSGNFLLDSESRMKQAQGGRP